MRGSSEGLRSRVIGLTGLPCSGKGEAAAALIAAARARGWRATHLSFSDEIKEEAGRRGMDVASLDRDALSSLAVEMRLKEGPGVLAARIAEKIRAAPTDCPALFVVEAIRHTAEIDTLREAFNDRFLLVAVESEPSIVAQRLLKRRRPDESRRALRSEKDALDLIESELTGALSSLGPNVGECIRLADVHLTNNGTLEELRRSCRGLFESVARGGSVKS